MKYTLFFSVFCVFAITLQFVVASEEAIDRAVINTERAAEDLDKIEAASQKVETTLGKLQHDLSSSTTNNLDTVNQLMGKNKGEFKVASGVQVDRVVRAETSELQKMEALENMADKALERVGDRSAIVNNDLGKVVDKQAAAVAVRDQHAVATDTKNSMEQVGDQRDIAVQPHDDLAEYATRVQSADRDLGEFAQKYRIDLDDIPKNALKSLGETEKDIGQLKKDLASKNQAKVKAAGLKVAKLKTLYYLYVIAYRSEYGPYGYSSSKTGSSYEPSPYVGWGSYTG